jgi:hypothetical protein
MPTDLGALLADLQKWLIEAFALLIQLLFN